MLKNVDKFLYMISVVSNKIMSNSKTIDGLINKEGIEKKDLKKFGIKYCDIYRGCTKCPLDSKALHDGWCTCKVLIYLNKAVLGLWSDE